MSTLNFGLKIVGSNQDIANSMLRALLPDLNNYFSNIYRKMRIEIPSIIIDAIKNQPEYTSLMSGELMGQFGLTNSASRLNSILSTIESGTIIESKPLSISGGKIKGSIRLQMVQQDFNDLISLGDANFTTEKGASLPWLQWLLVEGDSIIISDYSFVAGPNPNSRTGMGIMQSSSNSFWRVPPEFAGTVNNNWITRAINSAAPSIDQTLQRILQGI